MDFDELPLDERLGQLTRRCDAPPEGADLPELLGLLGAALVERADRDGDPDLLDAAIGRYQEALRRAPDHEDRTSWYFGLGLAHALLADWRDDPARYDHSIRWLSRLYGELSPADADHDDVAMMLANAQWERYVARQDVSGRDAASEAHELVTAVRSASVSDTVPELAAHYRLILGLSHLARFEEVGDRPDLDLGIGALTAALAELPPGNRWYGMAWAKLGEAHQTRWEDMKQPADLDRAIECLQAAFDTDPDAAVARRIGGLRHERASRTDDAAEASLALDLLERAAADTDQARDGSLWYELALAHRTRWRLSRTAGSLEAAERYLSELLSVHSMDSADLLRVHTERIILAAEVLEAGWKQAANWLPRDTARLRRYLDDAHAASEGDAGRILGDRLAGPLAWGELVVGMGDPSTLDLPRIRGLLARARQADGAPPAWGSYLDTAEAMVEYFADTERPGAGVDFGVQQFLRVLDSEHLAPTTRGAIRQFLPYAAHLRANRRGDRRAAQATESVMRSSGAESAQRALSAADTFAYGILVEGRLDLDRFLEFLELDLPAETLRWIAVAVGVELPDASLRPAAPGPAQAGMPGAPVMSLLIDFVETIGADDPAALQRLTACWRDMVDDLPANQVTRFAVSYLGALSELHLASNGHDRPAAAARAVRWCEEAAELAGGPDSPYWPMIAMVHAQSLRWTGDENRARSRDIGMSAVRAYAWQAMLQAGTEFALQSARRASDYADDIANWCLADDAYDDLVRVLDAGRGLTLQAATSSRQVAGRLVDAGHPELAEEYLATGGLGRDQLTGRPLDSMPSGPEMPDGLRLRVLRALSADGTTAFDPLETAEMAEIQRALTTVDADALLYLRAADDVRHGMAVVVPAAGEGGVIVLPELVTGAESPLHRHLSSAGRGRDIDPPGEPASRAHAVDELCRWAWSAAMGDIVRRLRRPGRPVRLVLVPMGVLGLVPWHAAFTDEGGRRRYAVEDAVISYGVSARMLCASARHRLRPVRSALVVGDPDGSLPFAGVEAQAVHQRFYPAGSYFGRHAGTDTPAGTPEQVLDWIFTATGPSLLHFACHGVVDPRQPADAHLVLAGGALTARRLLDASRLSALAIEQVFLAACTTNVAGDHYDEAFSLSTAFLAAGARTVFGSLWPVPDAETSLLMYLVHHFIDVDSCAPVDALHRAQLWMLDPARQPPAGMPAALARQAARPEAADPLSWAGFTHLGR